MVVHVDLFIIISVRSFRVCVLCRKDFLLINLFKIIRNFLAVLNRNMLSLDVHEMFAEAQQAFTNKEILKTITLCTNCILASASHVSAWKQADLKALEAILGTPLDSQE